MRPTVEKMSFLEQRRVGRIQVFRHALTKNPPAAILLKKAANIASGSGEPNREKVGKITKAQLMEVVKAKIEDLNTNDPEAAAKIMAGTAKQMGIEIEG